MSGTTETRTTPGTAGTNPRGGRRSPAAKTAPGSRIDSTRTELGRSRARISRELHLVEARLGRIANDLHSRLDLAATVRERIRNDIWGSLGMAFAGGLAAAILTTPRSDGRRRFTGEVFMRTLGSLPAALARGARAGLAEMLRKEWRGRNPRTADAHPTSPAPPPE